MRPVLLAVVCLMGCEASILPPGMSPFGPNPIGGSGGGVAGTGGGAAVDVNPCDVPTLSVGTAPMRRLSHEEYKNTLGDIQPAWATLAATRANAFTQDSESLGFKNGAQFLDVKPVLAAEYMDAAEAIAAQAVSGANLTALLPCNPTGNEAACANQLILSLGRRLYRHTLSTEEAARYLTVYNSARSQGFDFRTGIEWVVFAFLNSPGFLYRIELDPPGSSGVRALTGTELASRLSYLLWQSAPDETLLTAAENGELQTRPQLLAQAERMVADPKARRMVGFFDQWLKWEKLDTLSRDATTFPGLPAGLGPLLRTEARTFAERTVFDDDGRLGTLLTGKHTYVNQTLAQHYGLSGVTGSAFQRVSLTGRGGLLMLGGTLATSDLHNRTSIVHRGVTMRTLVMCQVVAAPPPDIPALGPISPSLTQAQRLAEHRTNPGCAGCHNSIDPLGTPFEGFDAVGRARTMDEAGNLVDTKGELTKSKDTELNGPVNDANELVAKFAQSDEVRDCFATHLYRFSMGRKEEAADACSTYTMKRRFADSGGDVKQLLLSLTQLDDFDHRQVQP